MPMPRRMDVVEALLPSLESNMLKILILILAWFCALAMLILPILFPSVVIVLGVVGVLLWVATAVAFLFMALRGVDRA